MKTEEKAKKVQNIATALAAIFGAVGAFFGIFQAQMSANLKNQVTSLQNASQQTIVNVICDFCSFLLCQIAIICNGIGNSFFIICRFCNGFNAFL